MDWGKDTAGACVSVGAILVVTILVVTGVDRGSGVGIGLTVLISALDRGRGWTVLIGGLGALGSSGRITRLTLVDRQV